MWLQVKEDLVNLSQSSTVVSQKNEDGTYRIVAKFSNESVILKTFKTKEEAKNGLANLRTALNGNKLGYAFSW